MFVAVWKTGPFKEEVMKTVTSLLIVSLSAFLLAIPAIGATTGGSIVGVVTDTTGAVVPGVNVMALDVATGVKTPTKTNADGSYSFPDLPIGTYNIEVRAKGFSQYEVTGIILNVNSALQINPVLHVGAISQHVQVSANAVQVNTISTQLGDVIGSVSMTSLPLNGRSYTDLLALQPGVVPQSNESQNGLNSYSNAPPSGGLNDGTLSVSGARGSSNGFMVNGGNVEEQLANGTTIIPNVDSIAQFRIITSNYDAQYGHYSGGLVNVITKSGTNQIHGDAFEFLRNTDLDARNYYSPSRGVYHQNQFGGTLGGPFIHNKMFFFADYQGTRQSIGGSSGLIPVPSAADRQGNLIDQAGALTGSVIGPAFAARLSSELGYPVSVGEPFYTPGCTVATCAFPGAVIPKAAWSAPARQLLQYIPSANVAPTSSLPTGAFSGLASKTLEDNKAGFRVDANTRAGSVSGYYFIDKYSLTNPYDSDSFGQFPSATAGQAQLVTVSDTKTIGTSKVNVVRLSYMRNASFAHTPTTPNVDFSTLGFTVGCDTPGICLQSPKFAALPEITFNNFTIGANANPEGLWENTYQAKENFSWIHGNHSLVFGGIYSLSQLNFQTFYAGNGIFGFTGSAETGLDFADFLLGAQSQYTQGVQFPVYNRGRYYGIYAQDSWRATRNLTLNYGLRWDVTTPWWEKYNRMEVLVPGAQSVVFPGSPVNWLVAGDPQVPRTVAPVQYDNLAPRFGFAYSPDVTGGWLGKMTGGPGKTSVRASFGIFYGDIEDYINANGNGDAPYGLYWVSPTPPEFATPFVDLYTGHSEGQRFPVPVSVANATASHPDSSVNWAQYLPISSSPTYYYKNVTPYVESWMMSIQRQVARGAVVSVNYVGNLGRHNMVIDEANPATPSVCLSVSQPSQVAPGSNICGPFSETGTFTTAAGQVIQARQQLGPNGGTNFGSTGWYRTMGASAYNSLQASLQYNEGRTSILVAYTYSKSMDDSSSATEEVFPFDPGRLWALSAFNVTHNFAASYSYQLPFDKLWKHPARLTSGWVLSGITRFSTGFPITISENDDRSLIGATSTGPTGLLDVPNFTRGKLLMQTNPRKGGTYFNTALFTHEALGQFGNSSRRFFGGPGLSDFDMAIAKTVPFTESKSLEFRAEFFNIFNHAQFQTPSGEINSSTFGVVTGAEDPRIGQVAVKFHF